MTKEIDSSPAPESKGKKPGGGAAFGGGANFQASLTAIVGAHILRGSPLGWLDGICNDVPIAVWAESEGPGDDLRIELLDGDVIEVQAKKGLQLGAKLWSAIMPLVRAIHHGHLAYGILAVASDSSPTIIKNLAADLERLGQGRIDRLTKVGAEFHDILISDGVSAERVCRHLRTRVIDTLLSNNRDINAAKEILASICEQESDAAAAFDILSHRALGLIENRGRWTLQGILRLLKTRGIKLRNDGSPAALLEPTGDLSAAFHVLRSSNMEPCSEMLEKALSCLCSECKSTSASAAELLSCWLNEGVVIDADKVDKAIEHWGGFQTAKPLLRLHTPLHSIIELSDKIRATTMAAEK